MLLVIYYWGHVFWSNTGTILHSAFRRLPVINTLFFIIIILFSVLLLPIKKRFIIKSCQTIKGGLFPSLLKIFLEIIFYLDICLMQKTSQFYIPFHHGVCVFIECIIRLLNIFTLNRFSHSTMQNTRHFSCFKGNIHCNQRVEWSEIHRDNSFFVNNVMVGWTLK